MACVLNLTPERFSVMDVISMLKELKAQDKATCILTELLVWL